MKKKLNVPKFFVEKFFKLKKMKFVILNFFLIFFFASSEENFCTKDGQGKDCAGAIPIEELTAKDYYFDSYGHYYIHEVCF